MSTAYQNLTPAQLREEYTAVKAQFDALKAKELKLNMARGKQRNTGRMCSAARAKSASSAATHR